MKKAISVLVIAAIGSVAAVAQSAYYQGRTMSYSGYERPISRGNTIVVPARRTADMIGAAFDRNDRGNQITMRWHDRRVNYIEGDASFMLDGQRYKMGASSIARNGVLFVPSELFSALTDGDFYVDGDNGWGYGQIGDRNDGRWRQNGNNRWNNKNNNPWNQSNPNNGRWNQNGGWSGGNFQGIWWDGRALNFSNNEQPYMHGNTLMVPFRAMADKIGARTDRTADGRRVWIYMNGDRVEYDKGHNWYRFNSDQRTLGTISEDRYDLLFVPVELFRAIGGNRLTFNR